MNNLVFGLACLIGLAINVLLIRALLKRVQVLPVLETGGKKFELDCSPFVVGAGSAASTAHIPVGGAPTSSVEIRISFYERGRWRLEKHGVGDSMLNGRLIKGQNRLFDGDTFVVEGTAIRFTDPESRPIPPKVPGYRLLGRPTAGGSSRVYDAFRWWPVSTGAAVKVRDTSREDADKQVLNDRIQREFELLDDAFREASALMRPRFPQPYDLLSDDEGFYAIAMERVQGETVFRALTEGHPPSWTDFLRFGVELAAALDHLESRQIVHADIKPANIVLRENRWDSPCLVDFGNATKVGGTTQFGSEGYMSPEHGGLPLSPLSDIYVLGKVLVDCRGRLNTDEFSPHVAFQLDSLLTKMQHSATTERPNARDVARYLGSLG